MGLLAVVSGDVAIGVAATLGVIYEARQGPSQNGAQIAAILSGAFTTIGTMTTAYFGIKGVSNAAANLQAALQSQTSGDPQRPPNQ